MFELKDAALGTHFLLPLSPLLASFLHFFLFGYSKTLCSQMVHFIQALWLALSVASVLVSANPLPTAAPDLKNAAALQKRASCTFTAASAASASKKSCATIVLDGITVPSGVTLDLTGLTSGTHVSLFCSLLLSSC